MIFYLMTRRDWERAGADTIAEPGAGEKFVHCCDESQIAYVREHYFPADEDVVALAFDPTLLPVETRYEPGTGGESARFPHVYGPLGRESAVRVRDV